MPSWTTVASDGVGNIHDLALAREENGTLYIAWQVNEGTTHGIRFRTLSPDATLFSSILNLISGWGSLSDPAIRVLPSKSIHVLFGGLGTDPDHDGALFAIRSVDSGASWLDVQGPFSASESVSASDVVSVLSDYSMLISAWQGTGGVTVHIGEDDLPGNEFAADQSSCCGYHPNFAKDGATGDVYLGWYSNATGQYGQYVQRVVPNDGTAMYVPGSARADGLAAVATRHRQPIMGRSSGYSGIYVAFCEGYPGCDAVKIWRYGDAAATTVNGESGSSHVNLFKAPDGGAWVTWSNGGKIYATRSNSDISKFGRIQSIDIPGDGTLYKLTGEGSTGPLDLFALAGLSGTAHYHARFLPALTLKGRKKVRAGKKARFKVTDAGTPVQGAKVKFFGKKAITNAKGKAVIKVPSGRRGKKKAKATKSGYEKSNVVKVKII